jgi:hypothetical protein
MNIQKKAVDLTDLAVGILILGILVSIGSTILVNMRDSRLTNLATEEIRGEGIVPDDGGTLFAKAYFKSITECYNGTTPITASGNYTINESGGRGTITNTSATYSASTSSHYKCNYTTYNITRADWTLPNNASIGLSEYGNWFKILVIVGVAAVILALIFIGLGKGSQEGQGIGGNY